MSSSVIPARNPDDAEVLDRLSFLASSIARRHVDVVRATRGPARTDGASIFLEPDADPQRARTQALVHSALLGGGLTPAVAAALRHRHDGLRRYFLLEVTRAAAMPTADGRILRMGVSGLPAVSQVPRDAADSIRRASSGERLPELPPTWGVIDARLLSSNVGADGRSGQASPKTRELANSDAEELEDGESESAGRIAKLLSSPLGGGALGRLFQKLSSMAHGDSSGEPDGSDVGGKAATARASGAVTSGSGRSWFAGKASVADPPGSTRLSYPEWDVRTQTYRPDWCRVTVVSSRPALGWSRDRAPRDNTGPAPSRTPLLRALAPIGLRPSRVRRLEDGDDLDLDAVVDALSDPGSEQEAIYAQLLPRQRELAVLVLLDCSGSTRDRSRFGGSVFDRQRDAAALMMDVTSTLGCRTAALGFQSLGRGAVRLLDIKAFDERWGATTQRRLADLDPGAYTRIGAAIRHGTHSLKTRSGTAKRLLVVITDGFAYDTDYTAEYAEADAAHALQEARADGVGCLCLSVGSNESDDTLARVFGASTTALLTGAGELAPIARRLFRNALANADLHRRVR